MERGVKGGAVRLAGVDTAYDSELFGSEAEDNGGQGVAQREALHVEDLVGAQQHPGRGRLGVERGAELAQQLRRAGRLGSGSGLGLGKPIQAAHIVVEGAQLLLAAWLAGEALHAHVHGARACACHVHAMACACVCEAPPILWERVPAQVQVRVGAACMSLAPTRSIFIGWPPSERPQRIPITRKRHAHSPCTRSAAARPSVGGVLPPPAAAGLAWARFQASAEIMTAARPSPSRTLLGSVRSLRNSSISNAASPHARARPSVRERASAGRRAFASSIAACSASVAPGEWCQLLPCPGQVHSACLECLEWLSSDVGPRPLHHLLTVCRMPTAFPSSRRYRIRRMATAGSMLTGRGTL
eukprot:scaffold16245_cov67-Phaeocystis_antarctica.AAC.1